MSYTELITAYPWVDLVLELFSKIVPVIVAIMAIIINNNKSRKRDKINKRIDMIVEYENNLINKISEIESNLDILYDICHKILKCENRDKAEKLIDRYYETKSIISRKEMDFFNYVLCSENVLEKSVNAKSIVNDVTSILKSVHELVIAWIEKDEMSGITDEEAKELKNIQHEIVELKSWLTIDMKQITDKTFELLK